MKNLKAILVSAVAVLMVSCGTTRTVPLTGRQQNLMVEDGQILSLATQQYQEFMKTAKLSTNAANTAMVKRVGQNLANAVVNYLNAAGLSSEVANYKWTFNLVQDKQVNAWCMPGGLICVYEGLLPVTQDEASLAIVLGHEIAHAVARHSAEQMSTQIKQQYGLQIGAALLGQVGMGANTSSIIQAIAAQGFNFKNLKYSRNHDNKYIVNSGFTMGVWLMAYEMNKSYFDTLSLNIPESVHRTPDMLEEAMYNLRWMMTMQDLDGGVYHKLTEPDFEGFIAPHKCRKPRYVVLKTTAAALDFAATMALAARVYAPYEKSFPGFPGEAAEAAIRAYQWAEKNPRIYYDQPAINEKFTPAINTGAYDDTDVRDEFLWAATELYLLTGDEKYKSQITHYKSPIAGYQPAVWGNVWELAYLEQAMRDGNCDALLDYLKPLLDEADRLSVFRSPYGNRESDFFWGCNSEGCCWRGIECLYAYRLTGDDRFLRNAARCLDYVLGQNATGYCYVTGFGTRPTSHPHHRLSYSHPKGTIPGFLAGGPNPAQQDAVTDGVRYPKNVPADESYLDKQPSYASNEVTINWNVTLFALTAGLDALSHP